MYNDPSGEIFFFAALVPILGKIAAGIVAGAIAGAIVGATSYMLKAAITNSWSWSGFGKSILMGAVGGAISGGYNPGLFSSATGTLLNMGSQVISSILPAWEINIGNFSFSISPSIAIGKGWGFGANVSATFHAGDFSLSAGFGIMHYGAHAGSGESGWEYRKSAQVSYDNGKWGLSLGTNKWSGLHEQQTGIFGFRKGDFSMMYENDGAPFDKKGIPKNLLAGGTDKYRTAAMRFQIGDFQVGFNLFTGDRDLSKDGNFSYRDDFGRKHRNGAAYEVGPRYRLGAAYVGWGNYRIGTNSEHIRHAIQNVVAHHVLSPQGSFENLSWDWKFYFQYQTKNKFTSW